VDVTKPLLDKDIDIQKLQTDKTYFVSQLRQMFYYALHQANMGNNDRAAFEFERYFRYLWTYGGNQWNDFGTQTWGIDRYHALLTYVRVVEKMQGPKASEHIINQELLRDINLLSQDLDNPPPAERELAQTFVEHMQDRGTLPTLTTLNKPIAASELLRVGQFFQSHGFLDMAERLYTHTQLRNVLDVYRAEAALRQVSYRQAPPGNSGGLLAFPYLSLMGTPMAPNLPNPYELQKQRESKEVPASIFYYTHNVNAIEPIHKDPDQEDERKKRQKKPPRAKSEPTTSPERVDNSLPLQQSKNPFIQENPTGHR